MGPKLVGCLFKLREFCFGLFPGGLARDIQMTESVNDAKKTFRHVWLWLKLPIQFKKLKSGIETKNKDIV